MGEGKDARIDHAVVRWVSVFRHRIHLHRLSLNAIDLNEGRGLMSTRAYFTSGFRPPLDLGPGCSGRSDRCSPLRAR